MHFFLSSARLCIHIHLARSINRSTLAVLRYLTSAQHLYVKSYSTQKKLNTKQQSTTQKLTLEHGGKAQYKV